MKGSKIGQRKSFLLHSPSKGLFWPSRICQAEMTLHDCPKMVQGHLAFLSPYKSVLSMSYLWRRGWRSFSQPREIPLKDWQLAILLATGEMSVWSFMRDPGGESQKASKFLILSFRSTCFFLIDVLEMNI